MSLRTLSAEAGYSDHTYLSKVLAGRRDLTPSVAAAVDDALDAGGDIIRAAEQDMAREREAEAARLPLAELASHAAALGAWAETSSAGPGAVSAIEDEIARIVRAYPASAPGPLVTRAFTASKRVHDLLTGGDERRASRVHSPTLRHSRKLHVVGARCSAFLSVALGDLAEQAEAASFARTALILAEESEDPDAIALALSAESKVAFWDGRRQHAADLAARGYQTASNGNPLKVLLACQEADASPVPRARGALADAATELDAHGPADPGLFSVGPVRLAAYTSTLRLREQDPAGVFQAADTAAAAIRHGDDDPSPSAVQVQISAALAALAAGDPGQAAERLTPVLRLDSSMRLATYNGKLSRVAAVATASASPEARQLADDVRGYLGQDTGTMPYPLAIGAGA